MTDFIERIAYGVFSAFIAAGIAMAILFWTDGEYQFKFFLMFMIPAFLLGMFFGKKFYETVWDIFRAIW